LLITPEGKTRLEVVRAIYEAVAPRLSASRFFWQYVPDPGQDTKKKKSRCHSAGTSQLNYWDPWIIKVVRGKREIFFYRKPSNCDESALEDCQSLPEALSMARAQATT